MKLSQLLSGVEVQATHAMPAGDPEIAEVRDDSRQVGPGDLFVALPGQAADGHRFLPEVAARGAAAALVERADPSLALPQVVVPSAARALATVAANRNGRPADELLLCAVTGTNGKTTTSFLVEALLQQAGQEAGLIGTVLYRYRGKTLPAPFTTPTPLQLHRTLREMRACGVSAVAMEASSHALALHRLHGVRVRVAAFTNLTQDHLDFHGDMERYFLDKARLFQDHLLPPAQGGVAVIHTGNPYGARLAAMLRARPASPRILTVSAEVPPQDQDQDPDRGERADIYPIEADLSMAGIHATLRTPAGKIEIRSPLIGRYNLENLAVAAGIGVGLSLSPALIGAALSAVTGVPGRVQRVSRPAPAQTQGQVLAQGLPVSGAAGPAVFVDYAHTPDALERVLKAIRPYLVGHGPGAATATGRPGRLIVVFGCGGDRDQGKRPIMGQIAVREADLAIVTSDNPRSEDPQAILDAITAGMAGSPRLSAADLPGAARGHHVEPDRRSAIRAAISAALRDDVVVIAGKGHEDYQILGKSRVPFDDREEAAEALRRRAEAIPEVRRPASGPGAVPSGPVSVSGGVVVTSGAAPAAAAATPAATIELPLERVLSATSGSLLRGVARRFSQVVIDGRAAAPGALFVALRGERHDGHDFVGQAISQGASGVLIERGRGADLHGLLPETLVIEVGDTTVALGQIARAHREALGIAIAQKLRIVAVTGSTGKTTTKDMLAEILAAHAGPALVLKTEGNLNNHWGAPLTLLRLRPGHRYGVIELGMSARGEIAYLTSLCAPDTGVITNVAPVHLLGLGTIENVALAKGELFLGLEDGAAAVYPAGPAGKGHERVVAQAVRAGARSGRLRAFSAAVLETGAVAGEGVIEGEQPVVRAEVLGEGADGLSLRLHVRRAQPGASPFEVPVTLPLLGAHQAHNAALATAAALSVCEDLSPEAIRKGLAQVRPGKHRGQILSIGDLHVIDDCYNASPISVRAALRTLAAIRGPGRGLMVFGDMLELGPTEATLHEEIGQAAAQEGVALLIGVGPLAAQAVAAAQRLGVRAVDVGRDAEAAAALLADEARPGDWVLVKGSRGMRLEQVIDALARRKDPTSATAES
jgi:murE/murF fusion protein